METNLRAAFLAGDSATSFRLLDASRDNFLQCTEIMSIIKNLGMKDEDFLRMFDK